MDPAGEEAYWQVVRQETPPLFGCALELGALCGGAEPELAAHLGELGVGLGEIIQISDDLGDAMARPAAPDWQRRWTNLPILYARQAAHPERERFAVLHDRAEDPEALAEAQAILVRSGAVSYAAYKILHAHEASIEALHRLPLRAPESLVEPFKTQIEPLEGVLESLGVSVPRAELANPERA